MLFKFEMKGMCINNQRQIYKSEIRLMKGRNQLPDVTYYCDHVSLSLCAVRQTDSCISDSIDEAQIQI